MALLFGEQFGDIFAVLVLIYYNVLGCGDEAVLNAAVTAKALLISPGMEKSYIEGVVLL